MEILLPPRTFILFNLAGAGIFWGSSFVLIKATGGAVHALTLSAWRGIFAALALAVFVAALRQSPLPERREVLPWAVLGFINGFLPNVLIAYAMQSLPAGPGAMLVAGSPLFTALLAHFAFDDERLTLRRIAGIVIGFCGVGLLVGEAAFAGGGTIPATLAMLATALLYAIGNVYIRTVKGMPPLRMALGQQVFSAVFGVIAAVLFLGPVGIAMPAGYVWLLVALGVVATAIPITLFMRLIQAAGPTTASMTGYLVPACAAILAVIFLGETLGLRQLLAGAVILAGVYIVSSAPRRQAA